MATTILGSTQVAPGRSGGTAARDARWLSVPLAALGVGLAANSLLGPGALDVVDYPLSPTLISQTVGLEWFSLLVVAPACLIVSVLIRRGVPAGTVLALGPAGYSAYMLMQYIVGPNYDYYPPVLTMHLALFVLSMLVVVGAWAVTDRETLFDLQGRSRIVGRRVLIGLAVFLVVRYLPGLIGSFTSQELSTELQQDPAMFWSILWLDLGLVLPAAVATVVGLRRAARWGPKAMYGLVGWLALVPPSVAAMAIAMVVRDDANGSVSSAVGMSAAAVIFTGVAIWVLRPLVRGSRQPAGL